MLPLNHTTQRVRSLPLHRQPHREGIYCCRNSNTDVRAAYNSRDLALATPLGVCFTELKRNFQRRHAVGQLFKVLFRFGESKPIVDGPRTYFLVISNEECWFTSTGTWEKIYRWRTHEVTLLAPSFKLAVFGHIEPLSPYGMEREQLRHGSAGELAIFKTLFGNPVERRRRFRF